LETREIEMLYALSPSLALNAFFCSTDRLQQLPGRSLADKYSFPKLYNQNYKEYYGSAGFSLFAGLGLYKSQFSAAVISALARDEDLSDSSQLLKMSATPRQFF
jgi:hypothetical protein